MVPSWPRVPALCICTDESLGVGSPCEGGGHLLAEGRARETHSLEPSATITPGSWEKRRLHVCGAWVVRLPGPPRTAQLRVLCSGNISPRIVLGLFF